MARRGQGECVCWCDEDGAHPLRSFDSRGAAREFAELINDYTGANKAIRINAWMRSYNPDERYYYPQLDDHVIAKLKRKPIDP